MIRKGKKEDAGQVLRIFKENCEEVYKEEKLGRAIEEGELKLLVYEEKGEILGFLAYLEKPYGVVIDEIHVKKGFRGRGIGKKLVKELENLGRDLITYAREEVIPFFEELGFERKDKYYPYMGIKFWKLVKKK
ncbi:MAG: GNAT family N-acetyltransferase [Nanoarchaeota archaeon]|nr:GNAT family N-acetyltransferase [Nanoarchaeota archaeon]